MVSVARRAYGRAMPKHPFLPAGVIAGNRQGREQIWTLSPQRLAEGRRHLDVIAAGWDDALARFKMLVEE